MASGRRDQRSDQAQTYRRLYGTARWRATRKAQLAKQPLCETCLSQGRITAATVCNHADKDSKATLEGFYAGPFTSLCALHHDSTQQREEKRGRQIGCNADGIPNDSRHHWNVG